MGVVYTDLQQLRDDLQQSGRRCTENLDQMLDAMSTKIVDFLRHQAGPDDPFGVDVRVLHSKLRVSITTTAVPRSDPADPQTAKEQAKDAVIVINGRVILLNMKNRALAKLHQQMFPQQNSQQVIVTMPTGVADAGVKAVSRQSNA